MDHKFHPSLTDNTKCMKCAYDELSHGEAAVCDACPNIGPVEIFCDMKLCRECIDKEMKTIEAYQSPEYQRARLTDSVIAQAVIAKSQQIDMSIQLRTDIFNAATISIIDLKSAVEKDETVDNKQFYLANLLVDRVKNFTKVISERKEELIKTENELRATQVYLNQLANTLRIEEREKLKIADISYKPESVKIVKPKAVKRAKIDKVALKKYAAELGIGEFILQQVAIQKGISIEDAANAIRRNIAESKSMSEK